MLGYGYEVALIAAARRRRRGASALDVLGDLTTTQWPGWWTTYDPALPALPGITYSGTIGVDAVVTAMANQRAFTATLSGLGGGPPLEMVDGRPVVRCQATGAKCLQGNFGTMIAAAKRPQLVLVGQPRDITAANYILAEASAAGSFTLRLQLTGGTLNQGYQQHPNTIADAVGAWTDLQKHIFAGCVDAAAGSIFARDGSIMATVAGQTAATVNVVNRLTIGGNRNGAGVTNFDFYEGFLFDGDIGPTRMAALCGTVLAK